MTLWRFTQPTTSTDLRLTQITFDPGVTTTPAITADGKTIAYASDRESGSNLDLYVQPAPSGSAVRLTNTIEDESDPSFSPDGDTLAFHSSKDGGGIYTMPAAGGLPHLLAAGGRHPRYSTDGRWIAFCNGDDSAVYVVAHSGGSPRPFHPEFVSAGAPAWSADSRTILFWGRHENGADDLWIAPLDGGAAEPSGLAARLAKAGLSAGISDDYSATAAGLLFSARTGFVRNLYRCPTDRIGRTSGDIVRLTNGTELIDQAAASPQGRLAFSSGRERFDIWGVPLDGDTGKVTGAPYRITDTLAPTANPDISKDGSKLLFGSSRNGFTQIWQKDLASGREFVAATGPEGAGYGRWTPGGRILFVQPSGGSNDLFLLDPANGPARKLASGTRAWDVDSKERIALVSGAGIETLDLQTGARSSILRAPDHTTLSEASFSPDGRWILFLAQTSRSARIYVARPDGTKEIPAEDWRPLTDGSGKVDKPRFSPRGNLIYFTLDRDGTRAIYAEGFNTQTGQAPAQTFEVCKFPSPRLSLFSVNRQALEIGVAHDKVVMILGEYSSNIWVADLVPR